MKRKGIILAGGTGSRLWPITQGVSKQLLPVYDKPMIFYPLSILMMAGVDEVAIITTPSDQEQFRRLLGDGSFFGIRIEWVVQPSPDGLAQAYLLCADFLAGSPSILILGDNLFFGHGLPQMLETCSLDSGRNTVFTCKVSDPERYGVAEFGDDDEIIGIQEKPSRPKSSYAVTGLYMLDETAAKRAAKIKFSARGELEITSLLQQYIDEQSLTAERLGRGYAWFDTGTCASLLDAASFIHALQERQGIMIGCLEEIAYERGLISRQHLRVRAEALGKGPYAQYLKSIAH